ncbi:MAG: RDD family protein, partial [Bosea sp.]|uniref:hypothetical protein n=1 Tax=Bosea sp. (in: a-proteobacteria) TaxID=1871050 RepID=UPI00239B8BD3|nr:RDD family protein [Bosea sp. (in: a-proteobacteria)]
PAEEPAPFAEGDPVPAAPAEAGQPGLRVMHDAEKHLRLASMIVAGGCLIPWMSYGAHKIVNAAGNEDVVVEWLVGPTSWVGAKLVILAGIWLLYQSVELRSGGKVPGFIATLGGIVLGKKPEPVDPKVAARRAANRKGPAKLEVPFPTALHIVGFLLAVLGIAIPLIDPAGTNAWYKGMGELGMLAWAGGTFVHIHAYERWGSFNPLFPLMFIGMLFAGGLNVVGAFGGESPNILGLAGGAIVAIGGGLAAYTIVEAMMQAKKEGDAKKAAENERRKAARDSRKSK